MGQPFDGKPRRQQYCDVRDIIQGLLLGIKRDESVGQENFDWGEIVPYLAERYQMDYVEAHLPPPNWALDDDAFQATVDTAGFKLNV